MSKTGLDSEFYCTRCGKKGIPIPRQKGKGREAGHLKKLFCLFCGIEINSVECKPYTHYDYSDFLFEFNNKNFDAEGNRIMPYGLFKEKKRKEGVVK